MTPPHGRNVGVGALSVAAWLIAGATSVAFSSVANAQQWSAIERLRNQHRGAGDLFQVRTSSQGHVHMVMGRFAVGARSSHAAELAIQAFVQANIDLYNLPPSYLASQALRFSSTATSATGYIAIRGFQAQGSIRLRSSSFVGGFDRDGNLVNLTGTFWPLPATLPIGISPSAALGAAASALGVAPLARWTYSSASTLSRRQWVAVAPGQPRVAIERVFDPETNVVVWELFSQRVRVVLTESTLAIAEAVPAIDADFVGLGYTYHRDYDPDDLNTTANIGLTGHMLDRAETAPYPGYCVSYLGADLDGRERPILPTHDYRNPDTQVFGLCSQTPTFGATSWSEPAFRQQDTFHWLSVTRDAVLPAWDVAPPKETAGIRGLLNTNNECGDVSNCFIPRHESGPAISFDADELPNPWQFDTVSHEFGHYFTWTYGDLSDTSCVKGKNESDPLDETIGDIVAFIAARAYWAPFVDYQVKWERLGFMHGGFPPGPGTRHTNGVLVKYDDATCGPDADPAFGEFFEHAIWEILLDVDCTRHQYSFCDLYRNGATDIGWVDATDANKSVIEALGFALWCLPEDTTFDELASWMVYYWYEVQGRAALALRAASIMEHHGMCVTVGCSH